MEDKLRTLRDSLSREEWSLLLDRDMVFTQDKAAANRVKALVYEKAGFKQKKRLSKTWKAAILGALFLLIMGSLAIVGFDSVAATIRNLFGIIPGSRIETGGSTQFVLAAGASDSNGSRTLSVIDAEATEDTLKVTIRYEISGAREYEADQFQNPGETAEDQEAFNAKVAQLYQTLEGQRAAFERETEGLDFSRLQVGDKIYEGAPADGGKSTAYVREVVYKYQLDNGNLNTSATYQLSYGDMTVSFRLAKVKTYASLAEIGPTDRHNDISLTAIPSMEAKKISIQLYMINDSAYTSVALDTPTQSFLDSGLGGEWYREMMTENGIYLAKGEEQNYPETVMGFTQFDHRVSDREITLEFPYNGQKDGLSLVIPALRVQASETGREVEMGIPAIGTKQELNEKVIFDGGTFTIKSITRLADNAYAQETGMAALEEDSGRYLKLEIAYQSDDRDRILVGANMTAAVASYMTATDCRYGKSETAYFYLSSDTDTFTLNISDPYYALTSPYVLKLNP